MLISVPGKFLLFGEYAVTKGGMGIGYKVSQKKFNGVFRSSEKLLVKDPVQNISSDQDSSYFSHLMGLLQDQKLHIELESSFHPFLGLGTSSASLAVVGKYLNMTLEDLLEHHKKVFPENSGYDLCVQCLEKDIIFENFKVVKEAPELPSFIEIWGLPFKGQSRGFSGNFMELERFSKMFLENHESKEKMVEIFKENYEKLKSIFPEMSNFFEFLDYEFQNVLAFKPLGGLGGDLVAVIQGKTPVDFKKRGFHLLNEFL